ncbi:MAG: alanine--tRNA ligase, partial [Muribaculaceae bacterium]|nr:alanine--tRNA ligase [Muribaculaceae bacterium]
TGPCGPCSEIHIDLRSDEERKLVEGANLVNKDNPLVIEIWNLVFMQYNRKADGTLDTLPLHVIDTGMGFERLCMALQNKTSNYDTDVFTPIINRIADFTNLKYGEKAEIDVAMRVVADHLRTISFSIADSQLPSNAKAGYVIRRILRRAVRYVYTFLNQKDPFIYRLVDVLVQEMGEAYPELKAQQDLIKKVIKEEEEAFLRTLDNGIKLLDEIIRNAKSKNQTEISGKAAFTLYDTYGFPLDLTELILRENGMTLNHAQFNEEMQAQKQRARNAAAVTAQDWVTINEGEQKFVGYDNLEVSTKILRYRKVKQKNKEFYQIIFAETPLYAEMGGQSGDKGYIEDSEGKIIEIFDTKREHNIGVAFTSFLPADVNSTFKVSVDKQKREATSANHSATHLLHYALKQVLGNHVEQKGSLVTPDALRFDFSHFQKVSPEQLRQVEHTVNSIIRAAIPLQEHRQLPIQQAKEMGALALFGEKYGDKVRVVKFGDSIELCGGTHVANTGNIGMIRIVSESSVAAGIRRIEAVSGAGVENMLDMLQDTLTHISNLLGATTDIKTSVMKALDENTQLKHQVEEFMKEKIEFLTERLLKSAEITDNVAVVRLTSPLPPEVVKGIAFLVRKKATIPTIFIGATVNAGKPLLTLALSDELVAEGRNAAVMLKSAAKYIKGGGGGQPFFAQAGGKNVDGLPDAMKDIEHQLGL